MDEHPQQDRIEFHDRNLMVTLSDTERMNKGKELAQAQQQLESAREEAKSVKASLNAKQAEIVARIGALAAVVRLGAETRPVRCYGIADVKNGRVLFYREDTGEFVGDRVIQASERQMVIPGAEAPPPKKEGDVLPFNPPRVAVVPDEVPTKPVPLDDYEKEAKGAGKEPAVEMVNVEADCGHMTAIPKNSSVRPLQCTACATGEAAEGEDGPEEPAS